MLYILMLYIICYVIYCTIYIIYTYICCNNLLTLYLSLYSEPVFKELIKKKCLAARKSNNRNFNAINKYTTYTNIYYIFLYPSLSIRHKSLFTCPHFSLSLSFTALIPLINISFALILSDYAKMLDRYSNLCLA